MTRLERNIKCMNDLHDLVALLLFDRIDKLSAAQALDKIEEEKRVLIQELRKHGCRRER